MSLHKQPELKSAVLSLPSKEKDKLLVRLIGKDKMLMKQLHFQLLEDELDLQDRIETLRNSLSTLFDQAIRSIRNAPNMSDIIALNKLMKQASGMINEHEKITKDIMSEVEFRLFVLNESIMQFANLFNNSHLLASQKLFKYVAGRIKHVVGKYNRLHEDIQFEYREDLQRVLDFAYESSLGIHLKTLGVYKTV